MSVLGGRPIDLTQDLWVLRGIGTPVGEVYADRGAGSEYIDLGTGTVWRKSCSDDADAWEAGAVTTTAKAASGTNAVVSVSVNFSENT